METSKEDAMSFGGQCTNLISTTDYSFLLTGTPTTSSNELNIHNTFQLNIVNEEGMAIETEFRNDTLHNITKIDFHSSGFTEHLQKPKKVTKRNGNVKIVRQDSAFDSQKMRTGKKTANRRYFLTPEDVNKSSTVCLEKGMNIYTKSNAKSIKRALRDKMLPSEVWLNRRKAANARENKRIRGIMNGFVRLRDHVPHLQNGRTLSNFETLKMAIAYIKALDDIQSSNCSRGTISTAASKACGSVVAYSAKKKMQKWLDEKLKSI